MIKMLKMKIKMGIKMIKIIRMMKDKDNRR